MLKNLLSCSTLSLLLLLSNSSGKSASQAAENVPEGFNPGPDAIAGDMAGLAVFGTAGTQKGVAIGLTTCNAGNQFINYFAIPDTRHPAVASNLYRMSSGTNNNDRFEQIGQSWVKHTFGAKQASACFSCQPGGDFTHLGVGCSDTYFASQSADQSLLGSRAWINPFTGVFPSNARDHTGHVHTAVSHMMLIESNDLNQTLNPGATYYAELLYVTPDEYAWCQTHAGECNMYNNSSYRQYSVSGTTSFTFAPVSATVRMTISINAWTGATINPIEPVPGVDGRAFIAYKVTGPVAGVYHYEYAVYNQNLDRGIQSFSVPLGCGVTVSNLGFHAPLNHPGFPNDGTQGDAGFSNAAWTSNQTASDVSWSTETFAQNQNANAVRWGTLYNFRFDSNHSPLATDATIGFFKTGTPVTVAILGPNVCDATPSPTATATATAAPTASPTVTPSATPTVSPTATATVTPTITPTITPTATPAAQALNLSTRMLVQTGNNVGIGGFIITGTGSKHVLLRGIGPSLAGSGVPDPLADPVLELHGPPGFVTIINDNWRDSNCMFDICIGCGPAPTNDLESTICATLDPGAYTAIIRGKNDTSGVGLVEVYDLNQAAASKLANLSTRAFVSTGGDIVIAGFILGNSNRTDNVILRGIGPSLTAFGVPNALANPQLELRNSSGTLIRSNNDWMDDAAQKALIIAAGLAPVNNLESAIAETLAPGQYTALLSGVNNGTGVGLVEFYDLGVP
jgi:hypothetical protein